MGQANFLILYLKTLSAVVDVLAEASLKVGLAPDEDINYGGFR